MSNDPTYKETKQPIELAKQADQSVAPDIEKARAAVKGQSKVELADNPDATKTTDARELEKQAGKDEKKDCKFCHGKGKKKKKKKMMSNVRGLVNRRAILSAMTLTRQWKSATLVTLPTLEPTFPR